MSESRWDKTAIEFSSKNHKILFSMTGVHEVITQGIFIEGCKHAEKELLTEQALHYVRAKQQARAEVIEQVKNIIEPYIRDSVLPQVLEELNKLERGA